MQHITHFHKPTWMKATATITAFCFMLFSLTGCGVSSNQEKQIAQVVQAQLPEFEQSVQATLSADPRIKEIRDGVWKWEYEKGENGKFLAKYGYYGKNPWWKILLGGLIGLVVMLVTFGNFYWSPWGMDASLFITVEVDTQASLAQVKPPK